MEYLCNNTYNIFFFDIPWKKKNKQEGHGGPVSLHWLIRKIHTKHYNTWELV